MSGMHYTQFALFTLLPETILSVKRVGSLPTSDSRSAAALPADSPGVVRGALSSLKVLFLRDVNSVDSLSPDSTQ